MSFSFIYISTPVDTKTFIKFDQFKCVHIIEELISGDNPIVLIKILKVFIKQSISSNQINLDMFVSYLIIQN